MGNSVAMRIALICGVGAAPIVCAQDLGSDVRGLGSTADVQPAHVVIHRGTVLGIADDAILSYEVTTGEIEIRYNGGRSTSGLVQPLPSSKVSTKLDWVSIRAGARPGAAFAKSACSSEAQALTAAIGAAQAACGGGQSLQCNTGQTLVQQTYQAYADYLRSVGDDPLGG